MQYAKVFVDVKSSELNKYYYYLIPSKILPYIKKYCIVDVPYGKTNKQALVYDIVRSVSNDIKIKLKSINRLIYKFPVIDDRHFYIGQQISNYYLSNLGQTLFLTIPKLSKKTIHEKNELSKFSVSHHFYQKYLILDSVDNRLIYYKSIIQKTLAQNKSVIMLFADFYANKKIIEQIEKFYQKESIIFLPKEGVAQYTSKWQSLHKKASVIIGTRNCIFNLSNKLGSIIIDEPHHMGFKEEQSIHHDTLFVANTISSITGANIFLGENVEYPSDLKQYKIIKNNFKYFKDKKIITLGESRDIINSRILSIIKNNLNQKRKTLLITDKIEESSGIICSDCKHIFYCKRCESLERKIGDLKKQCPKCKIITDIPYSCPKCKSTKLTDFGITAKNIFDSLAKKFPGQVQFIVNLEEIINRKIIVTTRYNSTYISPDFSDGIILSWEGFSTRYNLDTDIQVVDDIVKIASKTSNNLYIQTKNIEDEFLYLISSKKIRQYYKNILLLRKNYNLPPYKKIIKIGCKNTIRSEAIKSIHNLKNNLEKFISKNHISILEGTKKRNKYYVYVIIKSSLNEFDNIHKTLYINYKLFKLSNFQIDIDPINLI